MDQFWKLAGMFALWVTGVATLVIMALALGWSSLLVILLGFGVLGWIVYTFLYYRHCRREEFLFVLAGAADDASPLAPAVRAYLADRPRGPMRNFWLACVLSILPLPGFYWMWYRRNNFDQWADDFARLLDQGVSLSRALQMTPRLATRESILAASIGESTGQLAKCLRSAAQRKLSTLWIDLVPQLLYPLVLLIVTSSICGFMGYYLVPRFQAIYRNFNKELPHTSKVMLAHAQIIVDYWYIAVLGFMAIFLFGLILVFSSTARWYCPGFGSVYRRLVRSRVLRTLGLLLETGKPLPQSLAILGAMPFGRTAVNRIDLARQDIELGEPFADCLYYVGLLPKSMLPLLHTAERAGNLPWALSEMAETLYHRTLRIIQRIMQVVFPLVVVVLGLIVAAVVISVFIPLVSLTSELAL